MTLAAESCSATESRAATAVPPASRISWTTSEAGPSETPSPDTEPPMSFTTTDAPSWANRCATPLPIPRPGAGHDRHSAL